MGSKESKDLNKDDYENYLSQISDYFLNSKADLKIEENKKELYKKFDEINKKATLFSFIKKFLKNEKKGKIINKMQEIFISLNDQFEIIHKKDEEETKKFSNTVDNNEKNIINAIYISKILEGEEEINDVKIHDYAVYLYGEDVVEEIEKGNNENIDEDFKKYNDDNDDKLEPTEKEIEEKFIEICDEKQIDPKNYENFEDSSTHIKTKKSKKNTEINETNNEPSNENKDKYEHDENLNKNKYFDEELLKYYDIIFDIDSLENLKTNGWKLESNDEGYEKYENKKDKENTVVSVIGNKNKGKSFILAKLSNFEIPDGFNITTKGLSVIYPEYEDKNIIFLDTAGFEIPLCENDENFKFETKNENYLKLNEEEKKNVSIKDYLTEDEYITQTMKFTRDRQNTDYFLQKFILNSAYILLCIVNQLNLSDHKFLNRIQEENKDKKIFVIHNLKTFKTKDEVNEYIEETLLKLVTSKLKKGIYIQIEGDKKNNNNTDENNIYYYQVFDEPNDKNKNKEEKSKKREVIHLFMANEGSEAGNYYNNSTLEFIKNQIISFTNIKKFPIIDKVKDFLFEHSEEFFNDPLKNKDDIKDITENDKKLIKYTGEPYELKECYVDDLGNANFIQSNYKPSYRAYKVKFNDKNGKSNKLILDIEISGEVDTNEIKNPLIVNDNGRNIITISGNRNLKKGKKNDETSTIKNIAEYKASYFNNKNSMFNLRIYIPNEKCVIEKLYKRKFFVDNGLYRYVYNIQEKNNNPETLSVEVDDDDDDDEYDV